MRLILTALLAIYGAEPASQALISSPLAPVLAGMSHSADVLTIFGATSFMLQILFVMCCYEVVGILECVVASGTMAIGSSSAKAMNARPLPHGSISQPGVSTKPDEIKL